MRRILLGFSSLECLASILNVPVEAIAITMEEAKRMGEGTLMGYDADSSSSSLEDVDSMAVEAGFSVTGLFSFLGGSSGDDMKRGFTSRDECICRLAGST